MFNLAVCASRADVHNHVDAVSSGRSRVRFPGLAGRLKKNIQCQSHFTFRGILWNSRHRVPRSSEKFRAMEHTWIPPDYFSYSLSITVAENERGFILSYSAQNAPCLAADELHRSIEYSSRGVHTAFNRNRIFGLRKRGDRRAD